MGYRYGAIHSAAGELVISLVQSSPLRIWMR
jgi:hypothetical protein